MDGNNARHKTLKFNLFFTMYPIVKAIGIIIPICRVSVARQAKTVPAIILYIEFLLIPLIKNNIENIAIAQKGTSVIKVLASTKYNGFVAIIKAHTKAIFLLILSSLNVKYKHNTPAKARAKVEILSAVKEKPNGIQKSDPQSACEISVGDIQG